MAVRCAMCPGIMVDHCASPGCTWMRCINALCAADLLDIATGRLRLNTGVVVVRGDV